MKEFENAPKHLRDQYSVRNVTNLNEFVVKIMEDPKLVIDAIVANVTYAKPLLFNPVGVQAKVIRYSWQKCFFSRVIIFAVFSSSSFPSTSLTVWRTG